MKISGGTMENDVGLGAYFYQNPPAWCSGSLCSRTVNALRRAGIATMEELCATSVDELSRLRLLGEKSLELVLLMREKYSGDGAG